MARHGACQAGCALECQKGSSLLQKEAENQFFQNLSRGKSRKPCRRLFVPSFQNNDVSCPAACSEGGHDGRIGGKEGCPIVACPAMFCHKVRKPCGRRQGKAQPWGKAQRNKSSPGLKPQHVVPMADKSLGHEAHGEGALASAVVAKEEKTRIGIFAVIPQQGPMQAKQSPASAQVGHHGDVEAAEACGKAFFPAHAQIERGILFKDIGAVPVDLDIGWKILVLSLKAQEKQRFSRFSHRGNARMGPKSVLTERLFHLPCRKDKAHRAWQTLEKDVLTDLVCAVLVPAQATGCCRAVHGKKRAPGVFPGAMQKTIDRSRHSGHRHGHHHIFCRSDPDGWGLYSGYSSCRGQDG